MPHFLAEDVSGLDITVNSLLHLGRLGYNSDASDFGVSAITGPVDILP